ncbi:MAG: nucleoside hydrolase [Muribaculaceae bacterium]|nr:nucleoside hydrolase [Muribaculaceae bacterium]
MRRLLLLISLVTFSFSVSIAKDVPQRVIFDTDMGNDIDDALALDMLYKYQDMGRIRLLGIMSSKEGRESATYIDIMNTWYGYPDIPIGIVRNGVVAEQSTNYASKVADMTENGAPTFKRTVENVEELPDAHVLYRKILAAQPDKSVVIICTGFCTNLARLLSTAPDSYSPLSGRALIARKVKYISMMGGRFDVPGIAEYNVECDIASCAKLFAECPVNIVTAPFELGLDVLYPGKSIEEDFGWASRHPLVEGYKAFLKMPYDRPTWDLTAVLHVLEPGKFMSTTRRGKIIVDEKGCTTYKRKARGNHRYLKANAEQKATMKKFFVDTITKKPKCYE